MHPLAKLYVCPLRGCEVVATRAWVPMAHIPMFHFPMLAILLATLGNTWQLLATLSLGMLQQVALMTKAQGTHRRAFWSFHGLDTPCAQVAPSYQLFPLHMAHHGSAQGPC